METITSTIQKMDEKMNILLGYESNPISSWYNTLMKSGSVEVGWRECCGSIDKTAKIRREWIKVVKKLEKIGIFLTVESVKHKNAYATNNGGFWNSEIFYLSKEETKI